MKIKKQELVVGDLWAIVHGEHVVDSCKVKKNGIGIACSGRVFLIVCISCNKNDVMNFRVVSVFYHMNPNNPNIEFHMADSQGLLKALQVAVKPV